MSDLKIAVPGNDYQTELTISTIQRSISSWTSLGANIIKVTMSAAHLWSQTPTAPEAPVLFVKTGGTITTSTGTGNAQGQIFRVLVIGTGTNSITINGTTTTLLNTDIVIYSTVTTVSLTTATCSPVYFPVFQASLLSSAATFNPQLQAGTTLPLYGSAQCVNFTTSANSTGYYNPDNTLIPLDASVGNTPTVVPTQRQFVSVSTAGQLRFGPQDYIVQSGTTASVTTYVSIVE
jgi:hypothetical protein